VSTEISVRHFLLKQISHGPDALLDTWPTVPAHKTSRDGDDDD